MNVTELARQLGSTKEELLKKLPSLGFDIGSRAIKVDNAVAEKIKRAWSQQKRTERIKEKIAKQEEYDAKKSSQVEQGREIRIPQKITVSDFASELGIDVVRLIGYLMKNGIMASLNEQIDFETACIIGEDYGVKVLKIDGEVTEHSSLKEDIRALKKEISENSKGIERPPVVVVMGHVDHGKTTLLDAIRNTNVVGGESGGITQHIGAYQVTQKNRVITFLDTPGHEAFKAMRERGGQVADVAILVVAADDGLKPQTLESINVIQKEKLPFVVAINKIDKPGADVDKVKKELSEINLVPEDWGGKTITSCVSAKKSDGIAELLDMVILVSDIEKFTADPHADSRGVIIESHIDKGEGPVATVLVQSGTLRVGDEIAIGDCYGKVKALKDWQNNDVQAAPPSMPVKILGLKSTPKIGEILRAQEIGRDMRKKSQKRYRFVDIESKKENTSVKEEKQEKEESTKTFFDIIVKADVLGSLEALLGALKNLNKPSVEVSILKQGLGNITESDLVLAETSGAVIYGFNVNLSKEAQKMSYRRASEIKISKIIYEILEDVENRMKAFVKTETIEIKQGDILVLKVFKSSRSESIIGGRVKSAPVSSLSRFRVFRSGEPIEEGKIVEIQKNKSTVKTIEEGAECGIKVSGARGLKEDDLLSCYIEEERQV